MKTNTGNDAKEKQTIEEIKHEYVDKIVENERNADASTVVGSLATASNDEEVIVLDSSPENSFVTTQATDRFKACFETTENTFYTAKSNLNNMSILSIDSDSSPENSIESSIHPKTTQSSDTLTEKPGAALHVPDITVDSLEFSSSAYKDTLSVTSINYGDIPNFNDSLERVDYMMEQAKKMMHDKNVKCTAASTSAKKTPVSQAKLKPKVLTPNSVLLKKLPSKNLTPNKNDLFKRPEHRCVRSPFTTKSASKAAPAAAQSRIPTKAGSLHKPQFRHIASPIAAYIKNTPEMPLLKTIKPMRNLLTEKFSQVHEPSVLDESTQSVESFPTKSALPRKMYISSAQRKVNDCPIHLVL